MTYPQTSSIAPSLTAKRILVIEDEGTVRDMIAAFLSNAGYEVKTAADGLSMQTALEQESFDLLLLDVNLPDSNGFHLLRELRAKSKIGIILVTERTEPDERAMGLELGADDYITKPFFPREMMARIRNVLDRTSPSTPEAEGLLLGQWVVDKENRHVVSKDGADPKLTPAEFDLLCMFIDRPGTLMTRDELANSTGAGERAVDILISRLRKKLNADKENPIIETVRGHGYRLNLN